MRAADARGLTLLEIVIAMSLSIVILLIVFSALRLGYRAQDKGIEKSEANQRIRIIEDRLSWLIRGLYPYQVRKADGVTIYFDGESDRIGFVTTSTDPSGKGPEDRAGLKWVSIYTDSSGLRLREKVFFGEDVSEDSGGTEYLFDPSVKKLEFEYLDVPPDEKTADWVSTWAEGEKDYFPSAVKLRITMDDKGRPAELPELIMRVSVSRKKG